MVVATCRALLEQQLSMWAPSRQRSSKELQVLTGGASAVYGADAVSGVVNYVTRTGRDFDGLEYRFQTGISDKGDAEEFFGSIAGGGTFDDGRGSVVFSVEYSHNTSILNGDRDFAAGPNSFQLGQSNQFLSTALGLDPTQKTRLSGIVHSRFPALWVLSPLAVSHSVGWHLAQRLPRTLIRRPILFRFSGNQYSDLADS